MRRLLIPLVVCFCACACADRVINTPTGYTLQPGEFRLDYHRSGTKFQDQNAYAAVGVIPYLEFGLQYEDFDHARPQATFDAQYSLIQPYPDLLPGVSVGMLDVLNLTERGRVVFLAATFQFNLTESWSYRERINLTIGAGTGLRGAFMSLNWPIYTRLAFIAEHDSRDLSAGFDFEPVAGFGIRALVRNNKPEYGIQIRRIF
ncbi:MAG: hypothetical protein U0R49_00680 [Fimbriimonadales bacterium]